MKAFKELLSKDNTNCDRHTDNNKHFEKDPSSIIHNCQEVDCSVVFLCFFNNMVTYAYQCRFCTCYSDFTECIKNLDSRYSFLYLSIIAFAFTELSLKSTWTWSTWWFMSRVAYSTTPREMLAASTLLLYALSHFSSEASKSSLARNSSGFLSEMTCLTRFLVLAK